MERHVIITVPHCVCLKGEQEGSKYCQNEIKSIEKSKHYCEARAATIARKLFEKFVDDNISTDILFGNFYRPVIDLNREEKAKHTNFWKVIKKQIETAKKRSRQVFLIDVHSFPHDTRRFADEFGQIPAIMVLHLRNRKYTDLAKKLNGSGVKTAVSEGAKKNFLIASAEKLGAQTILLEFNEDEGDLTKKQVKTSIDVISEYFSQVKKNNSMFSDVWFLISILALLFIVMLIRDFVLEQNGMQRPIRLQKPKPST
jgi:predicted N-formylglutamate amidohydrolase